MTTIGAIRDPNATTMIVAMVAHAKSGADLSPMTIAGVPRGVATMMMTAGVPPAAATRTMNAARLAKARAGTATLKATVRPPCAGAATIARAIDQAAAMTMTTMIASAPAAAMTPTTARAVVAGAGPVTLKAIGKRHAAAGKTADPRGAAAPMMRMTGAAAPPRVARKVTAGGSAIRAATRKPLAGGGKSGPRGRGALDREADGTTMMIVAGREVATMKVMAAGSGTPADIRRPRAAGGKIAIGNRREVIDH